LLSLNTDRPVFTS